MITASQKTLLHVAKNELGLDEQSYRDILEAAAGVRSSKDLDYRGFEAALKRFRQLGFRVHHGAGSARRRGHRHRAWDLVTRAQMDLIEHLYEDLGWSETGRRTGLNKRCCGKPWPQTREDGNKVIEALKAMLARQRRGRDAGVDSGAGPGA